MNTKNIIRTTALAIAFVGLTVNQSFGDFSFPKEAKDEAKRESFINASKEIRSSNKIF